jgi:hypothetical protein
LHPLRRSGILFGLSTNFTGANALTTLLTTESLLFAVFALTLSGPSSLGSTMSVAFWKRSAKVGASTLTFLATGAAVAWGHLFLCDWPSAFVDWFPVLAIAAGIIAQPLFAWAFVWHL